MPYKPLLLYGYNKQEKPLSAVEWKWFTAFGYLKGGNVINGSLNAISCATAC